MRTKQTYSDESRDRKLSAEITVKSVIQCKGPRRTLEMINACKGGINYIYLLKAFKKLYPYEKV
jgi:hypothetical protein